jgi:hypothetical protein
VILTERWHKILLFHSYELCRKDQSVKTENWWFAWAHGEQNWEWLPNVYGVFLGGDGNVLELDRGGGCTVLWAY